MQVGQQARSPFQAILLSIVGCCVATDVCVVYGHEGPPFPIIVDEPVGGMQASVWTDPDIGEARFFLILEPSSRQAMPEDVTARMHFRPTNHRLAIEHCEGTAVTQSGRLQIEFRPHFDQRDMWLTEFVISTDKQEAGHLAATVESTPPGFGVWDLGVYMIPFVLLGGLWGVAILRRQKLLRADRIATNAGTGCHAKTT